MSDLQTTIARALQSSEPVGERNEAARFTTGNSKLAPHEQIEIYREQFWLRHVKSLRDDFATLDYLLGKEDFEKLCRAYLAAHPPDHFRLRDLSAKMESFIASYAKDSLLADCARIEWALCEAFDAADVPPLDPNVIASIAEDDWPRAHLDLHPSVRVFECAYPVKVFREAVRKGDKPARPEKEASFYVAHRRSSTLWVEPIERASFHLLSALRDGRTLGEACEIAAQHDPETEAKLGEWFQRWVSLTWIANVRV